MSRSYSARCKTKGRLSFHLYAGASQTIRFHLVEKLRLRFPFCIQYNLTPKRMEATVWTVTKGHELDASKCVALMRESKTWQSVDCQAANLVPACVDMKNPRLWQLGSVSVVEADAAFACSALSASELKYSAPASGYENELLRSQLIEHAPRSIAGVWLNAKAFVSEVATVAQQLKVSPIDDIISVE
ncbi:unnamed protein product [Peronospora farinosa]|uniref:Uncharacterized protein n=1 Tax=Peronospora farinosa TaxID=134698 RepID=A0AAV0TAG2_9STRA|nr:unnamed protein product [Peronospora farinosa]